MNINNSKKQNFYAFMVLYGLSLLMVAFWHILTNSGFILAGAVFFIAVAYSRFSNINFKELRLALLLSTVLLLLTTCYFLTDVDNHKNLLTLLIMINFIWSWFILLTEYFFWKEFK